MSAADDVQISPAQVHDAKVVIYFELSKKNKRFLKDLIYLALR